MKKFILIRHGKAKMDGEDHLRKLDNDGILQSKSICEKLEKIIKNDFSIYSSRFVRAVDTIKPLAEKFKKEIIMADELKEINIGKSEELNKHEIIKKMWEDENFKVANGESQINKFNNMKIFLEKMFNSNGNEDIIIVTHGNLLGIILKFYFKRNFGFNDWKMMSMPDLYELSIENNEIISFYRNIENINKLFYIK
ncbi:histidine phosphatase family protein [Candidatus Pelagibacter sp. Uisw_113]|uniref:histidine phosphatase family protein n=1 Tax=Candidatus Pelagibacter sp. Uisw_113 TaxID=3230994 RepID=UPI0039E990BB